MNNADIAAVAASAGVLIDLADEAGVPLAQLTVSPDTTVGEMAAQYQVFGLPGGDSYALYRVSSRKDGTERVQRLAPDTRLGDIDVDTDDMLRLRFAPALRGA